MRTRRSAGSSLLVAMSVLLSLPYTGRAVDLPARSDWYTDIEAAREAAGEVGLPVLINFSGSDWCIPCMRLERDLFSTNEFAEFASQNLILLTVDFPSRKKNRLSPEQVRHNEALADRYNQRGTFPLVILTDGNGEVIGTMDHPLPSAADYIRSIEGILSRWNNRSVELPSE